MLCVHETSLEFYKEIYEGHKMCYNAGTMAQNFCKFACLCIVNVVCVCETFLELYKESDELCVCHKLSLKLCKEYDKVQEVYCKTYGVGEAV